MAATQAVQTSLETEQQRLASLLQKLNSPDVSFLLTTVQHTMDPVCSTFRLTTALLLLLPASLRGCLRGVAAESQGETESE